ncbi:S8 family peptidase [Marininema halotolerans]|nr:S8 family serine peptidase [Marininema halotolerans]
MKKQVGMGILLLVLLVSVWLFINHRDGVSKRDQENDKEAVHHEWVIKWKKGNPDPAFLDTVEVLHTTEEGVGGERMLVRLRPGINEDDWEKRWSTDEEVEYLHPNLKYKVEQLEDSTVGGVASHLYFLDQINAKEAWKSVHLPQREKPVTVAVVDTGIDLKHSFLQPWLTTGSNLKEPANEPQDKYGHGTHVAGVIAEVLRGFQKKKNVTIPIQIMPIKVMEGKDDGDVYYTAEGIREAVRKKADVILLSQGSWTYSEAMADAVTMAEKKGVIVVGAAGNARIDPQGVIQYNRPLYYPAAFPTVLGVASLNAAGKVVPTSNGGAGVDVAAPGDEIWTTTLKGKFGKDSGTSFAAPQVAAVAALIRCEHPDMTPAEVRNLIRQTAKPLGEERWDLLSGYGRLDVKKALTTTLKLDIHEPNDTKSKATPSLPNQRFEGAIQGRTDRDCLREHIEDGGTLTFSTQAEHRNDLDLSVQLEEGERATYHGSELQEVRLSIPPGDVTACFSTKTEKTIPYRIDSRFQPGPDMYENNDYSWNAANIDLPRGFSYVEATLHKKGDDDWYRVKVSKPGKLKVQVGVMTPRNDPVLTLYGKGKKKGQWDKKGDGESEEATLQVSPGIWYIRVSDYGMNIVPTPYHLFIHYDVKS